MANNKQPTKEAASLLLVEVAKEMSKSRFAKSARHSLAGIERVKPTRDAITHLAYALYLVRGCDHGRDVEDWVKAEKELSDSPIGQPQTIRAAHPARPVWFDKSSSRIRG
jgi:Protein of unknown function (DUF2934)